MDGYEKIKFSLIIVVMIFVVSLGSYAYATEQPKILAFDQRYNSWQNCGTTLWAFLGGNQTYYRCDKFVGYVAYSRDYDVQCSTWYGASNSCPREDIQVNFTVPHPTSQNITWSLSPAGVYTEFYFFTLNCHYYHYNDMVNIQVRYTVDFVAGNSTSNPVLLGGPC